MVEAMELRKGFKKTEVGIIPSDWEVKKLSEIGDNIIGLTYSPSNVKSHGTLVLRSSNIQNGKLAFQDNVFVEMDLPKRVIVKENDILICVRNGSRQLIGKCALIDKKTAGCAFGAFMSVYRSEFSVFAFHQFQSHVIQRQINETLGATINQITNRDLARFQIPLPPTKNEQTNISTTLDDADALITHLEKLIAKKKAIKKGAMEELLKPKKGWDVKELGELFEISSSTRVFQSDWKSSGIPFYRARELAVLSERGSVINELFITSELYELFKRQYGVPKIGDMLVTGVGTLGKVFVIPDDEKFYFKDGNIIWFKIRGSVNSEFLKQLYSTNFIKKQIDDASGKTTVGTYTNTGAKKTLIPIPSQKAEQDHIAQILSDMDFEIELLEKKLEKYKMVKQGMMQDLLTGKIRLI